jgi:hypothetical protein
MAKNQAAQRDELENAFGIYDDNSEKAKPPVQGNIPLVGSYIVEVLKVKMERSHQGHNVFIANLKVLQSNNPERPAGTRMDYVMPIKDPWKETKLGNIRGFLAAAYGCEWKQVDAKKSADACRSAQPLRGVKLALEVEAGKKKDGSALTTCQFEPLRSDFVIPANDNRVAVVAEQVEQDPTDADGDDLPF